MSLSHFSAHELGEKKEDKIDQNQLLSLHSIQKMKNYG